MTCTSSEEFLMGGGEEGGKRLVSTSAFRAGKSREGCSSLDGSEPVGVVVSPHKVVSSEGTLVKRH